MSVLDDIFSTVSEEVVCRTLLRPNLRVTEDLVHFPALLQAWVDTFSQLYCKENAYKLSVLLDIYKDYLIPYQYSIYERGEYNGHKIVGISVADMTEKKIEYKKSIIDEWIISLNLGHEVFNNEHKLTILKSIFEVWTDWGSNKIPNGYEHDYYVHQEAHTPLSLYGIPDVELAGVVSRYSDYINCIQTLLKGRGYY